MTVVAHAGHWVAELVYVVPVLIVVVFIALQALRDRRDPGARAQRNAEELREPTLDEILEGKR